MLRHPYRCARLARALFGIAALQAAAALAQAPPGLVERINEYRSAPRMCEDKRMPSQSPLAPHPRLAGVELRGNTDFMAALNRAGYAARRAQFVVLSGPREAQDAMRLLQERYCNVILSAAYADIGVQRHGNTWRIVLAKPLLSETLGDWRAAGKAVLEGVNRARAEPRRCGDQRFEAASPVIWNDELAQAALAHSRDMAKHEFFAHEAKDGTVVGERARRAGYAWRRIGENIAKGQGSAEQAISAWLSSPHHCANIMQPGFQEMGAAYALDRENGADIYWTQVFGTPRAR